MINHSYYATPEDGEEILRILESSPAKGQIELLYTRRPDAYASYKKECQDSQVFVTRKEGRIVGTFAKLTRLLYVDGQPKKVAYLCGLKKDSEYEGQVGFSGGFYKELMRGEADYYMCSVVAENARMHTFLERDNPWMQMHKIGAYTTFILNPRIKFPTPKQELFFRRANEKDTEALLYFLNEEGKKKDLFPVVSSLDDFEGLRIEDFYLLFEGKKIVAAAALWKQFEYRQYVVKRYAGIMKCAHILNPLLHRLGYIRLPKENAVMEFPMLSFFLSKEERMDYYQAFLSYMHQEIAKDYGMYVIGLPKQHALANVYRKKPNIHFDTELYGIHFGKTCNQRLQVFEAKIRPECGLL